MTDTMAFDAPWDQRLVMITTLCTIVLLGAAALLVWVGLTRIPVTPVRIFFLLNGLLPIAILAFCAMLAPRGYQIRNGTLRIERFVGSIDIPLEAIDAVEALPAQQVAGSRRTMGNGGLFGYYGRFRNAALGEFRMYATRGDGYVLLRGRTPYVLTPQAPELFIQAVNRERASIHGS
ncbi:MAG TPA: PH domain-containing protein [Candidatus Polarisedimenticolia bacterium]